MKKVSLIIAGLLISGIVFGQYKLAIDEVDEFEGTVRKITSSVKIGKTTIGSRVTVSVSRINESMFVSFTVYSDLGCVSKYESTGHLKFIDGTVLEMYTFSDIECGDVSPFSFMMIEGDPTGDELRDWTKKEINTEFARVQEIFRTKKLEKVKFTGTEYYTVLEVDADKQDALIQMFNLVK